MDRMGNDWSHEKQTALRQKLIGFWAQDVWEMRQCPQPGIQMPPNVVRFRFYCVSPGLNTELKYVCWQKFLRREWTTTKRAAFFHSAIRWLNACHPSSSTFLERPRREWEESYRQFLKSRGTYTTGFCRSIGGDQEVRQYVRESPALCLVQSIYDELVEAYDHRPEQEKDVWDLRRLHVFGNPSACEYKLNFSFLHQEWLRTASKQFISYKLATASVGTLRGYLQAMRKLSEYLEAEHRETEPHQISRPLMLDFCRYLAVHCAGKGNQKNLVVRTRRFLEICAREDWLPLPKNRLLYDEEIPAMAKAQPRYIPQTVLDQLNEHLNDLKPIYRRVILILQECGLRIGELLALPFDCLLQDNRGRWSLRFEQRKLHREHTIPVSLAVAQVIQEQQEDTRRRGWLERGFLFANDFGRVMKQYAFNQAMRQFVHRHNITDVNGCPFFFRAHRFRHTVGTRMINDGVPHSIIQRYLGHTTPEMTSRYAHIHDETLREKLSHFLATKVVDITGQRVKAPPHLHLMDLQWFTRNILAQALPNGYCAIPLVAGPCPHPNACLTCPHFRTDQSFLPVHQTELRETQRVLAQAEQNGWVRQIELNQRKQTSLTSIIQALEGNDESH